MKRKLDLNKKYNFKVEGLKNKRLLLKRDNQSFAVNAKRKQINGLLPASIICKVVATDYEEKNVTLSQKYIFKFL